MTAFSGAIRRTLAVDQMHLVQLQRAVAVVLYIACKRSTQRCAMRNTGCEFVMTACSLIYSVFVTVAAFSNAGTGFFG